MQPTKTAAMNDSSCGMGEEYNNMSPKVKGVDFVGAIIIECGIEGVENEGV